MSRLMNKLSGLAHDSVSSQSSVTVRSQYLVAKLSLFLNAAGAQVLVTLTSES